MGSNLPGTWVPVNTCAEREVDREISADSRNRLHVGRNVEPVASRESPIHVAMDWPFLGSEALAVGLVSRYRLDTRHDMIHRDVYVPQGAVMTPVDKAVAAWLWSGRRGVAAGLSAAALHGSKWIDVREVVVAF